MRLLPHPAPVAPAPPEAPAASSVAPPPGLPAHNPLSAIGRLALAGLFATVPHLFFRIERHGLERLTPEPSTYYAISHKRDPDAFLPLPLLLRRLGWRSLVGNVRFAMRADAFERGFLARMVPRPRLFSRLLRLLSVGPILRALGVYPVEGLHVRPAESWLREALCKEPALGSVPMREVLAPDALQSLAQVTDESLAQVEEAPLRTALAWRYQSALQYVSGSELFVGDTRRQAERRALTTIKQQLEAIGAWLKQGGSLYSSPEGRLTPDGRISPITGGFHRLLRAAPTQARIVPLALSYDFMIPGRPRLFLDIGEPIEQAGGMNARTLDARLRLGWLSAMRLTCTQLASAILQARWERHGGASEVIVALDELVDAVYAQAQHLHSAGRQVDEALLHRPSVQRNVRRYLRFAARHGIVQRGKGGAWLLQRGAVELRVPLGEVGYNRDPFSYACNEYAEWLAGVPAANVPAPQGDFRLTG